MSTQERLFRGKEVKEGCKRPGGKENDANYPPNPPVFLGCGSK